MLKSFIITISLATTLFLSIVNVETFKKESNASLSKYYYDGEVSPKERDKYFHRLTQDPNTKEVPIESVIRSKQFVKEHFYNNRFKNKNGLLSSYNWNVRGPYQIGGRVRAMAYDIRDENRLLAAGAAGGLWLSTNGGDTWRKVTNGADNHSVTSLVQDTRPGKENNWYYGTGERIDSKFRYGYGIYKSTDNGETWAVCNGTVKSNNRGGWDNPFDFIFRLVVDPKADISEDVIIASTALGGIQRSSDAGETWAKVLGSNFGNNSSAYSEIAVTSQGIFYATLSKYTNSGQYNAPLHGIYRSENGKDWVRINDDRYSQNYSRIVLGINPSNENEIYFFALTQNEGKQTFNHQMDKLYHSLFKYTYLSADGSSSGGEWTDLSENLPKPQIIRQQTNSQGGYNMVIKVHPNNPNTIFLGDVNVWRSTDGFTTSNNLTLIGGTCPNESCVYEYRYPNHHSDVHEFLFSKSNPNIMFSGTDGGIHKTLNVFANNVEWISLNNGFYTTQFYDVGIAKGIDGNYNILGGMQDNGSLYTNINDSKHIWTDVLKGDGFNSEIANDNSFIITSQNSTPQPKIRIWKSELDNAGNIVKTRRIDPIGGRDFQWNTPFALDPNNNDYLYLSGGGILWRQSELTKIKLSGEKDSITQGWDSLSNTFVKEYNWESPYAGEVISSVSVSKNPANIVYYGTSNGRVYRINNANVGNPTPIEITGNKMPKGANVNCIAINPKNADNIICVYSNYNVRSIFHSTNGGTDWVDISGTLEEFADGSGGGPAVQWVEILPVGEKILYLAGTSDGLFVTSILLGENTPWQIEALETIGAAWVTSIYSRYTDGFVAVGTYSQGVFSSIINSLPETLSKPTLTTKSYVDALDTLTINWNKVENSNIYKVELSKDLDFKNIEAEFYSKENSLKLKNLEQDYKKYYARIASVNAGGLSEYSEVIDITTFLGITSPILPKNTQTEIATETNISWIPITNAEKYRFQLNFINVFNNAKIDTIVSTNSLNVKLDQNRNYKWRVAAIRNDKQGLYSDVFSFKTRNSTSVDLSEGDIIVYPNPTASHINIKLKNLELNNQVKISIFNTNGKLLFNSNKYEESINISQYESGTYFIVIESKGKKIYKKITILQ